jgi:hypothetical protein
MLIQRDVKIDQLTEQLNAKSKSRKIESIDYLTKELAMAKVKIEEQKSEIRGLKSV